MMSMGLQIYLSNMPPAVQGSQTSIGFEDKEQKATTTILRTNLLAPITSAETSSAQTCIISSASHSENPVELCTANYRDIFTDKQIQVKATD